MTARVAGTGRQYNMMQQTGNKYFVVPGQHMQGQGLTSVDFKKTTQAVQQEMLVAGSWEGNVYAYKVMCSQPGVVTQTAQASQAALGAPVTQVAMGPANTPYADIIFASCVDNSVKMVQNYAQMQKLNQFTFSAPATCVGSTVMGQAPVCAAGSLDRTVLVVDPRQPTAGARLQLHERVNALDISGHMLITACALSAGAPVKLYDLRNPAQPYKEEKTALKYQIRNIKLWPKLNGFFACSVEGRVTSTDLQVPSRTFTFSCHKDKQQMLRYPVNCIAVHPTNRFATLGADGKWNIWDKDKRSMLKGIAKRCQSPLVSGVFNSQGNILAYAESYDWFQGVEYAARYPTKQVHVTTDLGNVMRVQ